MKKYYSLFGFFCCLIYFTSYISRINLSAVLAELVGKILLKQPHSHNTFACAHNSSYSRYKPYAHRNRSKTIYSTRFLFLRAFKLLHIHRKRTLVIWYGKTFRDIWLASRNMGIMWNGCPRTFNVPHLYS